MIVGHPLLVHLLYICIGKKKKNFKTSGQLKYFDPDPENIFPWAYFSNILIHFI